MAILELLIIGLALSMDAFAVTLSNSIACLGNTRWRRLAMPVTFGLFQGLMPLIGYFLGSFAAGFIDSYAGIIAFVILAVIGGKMIWEGASELKKQGDGSGAFGSSAFEKRDTWSRSQSVPKNGTPGAGPKVSRPVPSVPPQAAILTMPALLAQAVATSIDALIVGVSFLAMGTNIWQASSIVAVTTFACCLVALAIGRRFGNLLGDKAQIAGGIVLVLIGIKALF